ncbi:hypothetical protein VRRI112168_03585 [Vreelandella rituensis]|uniref:DotM C-terminal cytoplasmic domain-containing protein n=1 Tax=Vreelandella rituensis TaxID=2282306 RepID=A0A368U9U5_9GAMM|nr:hypothetical protein [Halomonas rituensis]RCV93735.1 hypothetical protein DU506_00855 [Halomonas rituensis]
MKEEDILAAVAFFTAVFGLGVWFYQDEIKGLWYSMDVAMLSALQYLPLLDDYYAQKLSDYKSIEPEWPSYWQYLVAGQSVWRPAVMVLFIPLCIQWARKAKKVRNQQGFDEINKAYIDKHYRTLSPSPATRQQWTVRQWFHHYELNKYVWGSDLWNERIHKAFAFQLGPPSNSAESRKLLAEFAEIIKKELVVSFGKDRKEYVERFKPDEVVETAIKCHAFRTTAMVRILAAARDDYGVVSPYAIRNRLFESPDLIPVWFSLNGLGRQTTHIESLGALSHFYVEVAFGEAQHEPYFRNAIKGLGQYREHLIHQLKIEDLDESSKHQVPVEANGPDEPRFDYSLTEEEDEGVVAR